MPSNKISSEDIFFFIIASFLLYFCQLLILFVPFRLYIHLFTDGTNKIHEKVSKQKVLPVQKALLRGLHYLPWKGKCLVQALTGKLLLKIFNLPGTIYLGVHKENGQLKAHAWLKTGNYFISGREGHRKFTIVNQFS